MNHNPDNIDITSCMNGSYISHDWAKIRDKKNKKKKKNRIEQPYRHLLCIAYGSAMEFPFSSFLFYRRKKENPADTNR